MRATGSRFAGADWPPEGGLWQHFPFPIALLIPSISPYGEGPDPVSASAQSGQPENVVSRGGPREFSRPSTPSPRSSCCRVPRRYQAVAGPHAVISWSAVRSGPSFSGEGVPWDRSPELQARAFLVGVFYHPVRSDTRSRHGMKALGLSFPGASRGEHPREHGRRGNPRGCPPGRGGQIGQSERG